MSLIRAVDSAWENPGIGYYLRLFSLLEPFALIALPVGYFVFLISLISLSFTEKITLTVALIALMIAVGSLGLQFLSDRIDERIRDITESTILGKVGKVYAPGFQPIVRAVIRRRNNAPLGVKLEDLYNLDPSLFEQHALLESLLK